MTTWKRVLYLLSAVFFNVNAASESSLDLASKGKKLWESFECAALAGYMGEEQEAERLFEYGYDQGHRFIEAVEAGKIEKADIRTKVPMIVRMRLSGPTPDFVLGRIYEEASEYALEDVLKDFLETDAKTRQKIARNKYNEGNCEIID